MPQGRAKKTKAKLTRKNGIVVEKPTHRRTWKKFEQKVANDFGAERNPLSGGNSKMTRSDSTHKKLFIEAKLRQSFPLWKLYHDTKVLAEIEDKIPVVAIKEKGKEGYLILVNPEHLNELIQNYKNGKNRD